jgi:signal recognition particle subunit SRP54
MFESLTDKLELTFKKLRGQGKITEKNIDDALREVRLALLEADVHIGVVKNFLESVKTKSLGQEVLQSLTPEQQFMKIVRDELINLLGGEYHELDLKTAPPVVIMLVGLQGSGKTTTLTKLAQHLRKDKKEALIWFRRTSIGQLPSTSSKSWVESWSCQFMILILGSLLWSSANRLWRLQSNGFAMSC